jgi:nitrate/nitrite transport system ATP-binding protein
MITDTNQLIEIEEIEMETINTNKPKPNIIEIKDLKISFKTPKGEYIAVKDINLNIQKGEIISLIGHSGCGKSTLMNAISGMQMPSSGEVKMNGKNITGAGPDRGIVFQNYSLLPWMNVYKNIYEAVDSALKDKTAAEKKEIVEKNLHMVHLYEHKDKLPKQLSGGMKQRVAIARAFAINPSVLLLDEPFGALDALTKGSMHIELLKLWNLDNRNKTIIMVTHDIEEAIFLSDRVVVMNNGPAATIKSIETVNIARPRNKKNIVDLPAYKEIRERLLTQLSVKFSIEDEGLEYQA